MKQNFQREREEDGEKINKYNIQQDGEDDNSNSLIYN